MDQKQKKQRLIVLLILILIISVWRGIALDQPDTPVFDEFHYIAAAQLYAAGEEDANNWEHINWEHPPLAKLLLSVGITVFGDNSLGWRIIPYIVGVLSAVLVFLIAEALGFSLIGASMATLFFGFDFLSFSLGRLAMLDVFVTFFSLLAWASTLFYHRYRHQKYFFFSILACGFAAASKWSGIFPVLLIGVYYLAVPPFFQRLGKLRYLASGGLVLVFFLSIMGGIYLLSYLPYFSFKHSFADWLDMQIRAWQWHTRPYVYMPLPDVYVPDTIPWWTWPSMSKSIWLFYKIDWTSAIQAELAIGNPIVWLFGQLAIVALLLKRLLHWREFGKFRDAFLVSGYCAALLPWVFLGGRGFLYYMLPAVPFMALSLAFWFDRYWNRKIWRIAGIILLILSIAFFLYFYPILAAIPIRPESYFGEFWRILTDWYPLPILSP